MTLKLLIDGGVMVDSKQSDLLMPVSITLNEMMYLKTLLGLIINYLIV